ncbi:S-adenosyl-L-methionine-dependent methyltransferase [Naviculisporaceae sp. PSN 640]
MPSQHGPCFRYEVVEGDGKIKPSLTPVEETALIMLHARALDTVQQYPILGDQWAHKVFSRLDYDFTTTGVGASVSAEIAARSRNLDRMVSDFLASHAESGTPVTVLHLGCGLDTRFKRLRLDHEDQPGVRWVDVDLPGIVALREEVLALDIGTGSWEYSLIAGSVVDLESWIHQVPNDRPALVVFEGLTMYLSEAQGRHLFEGIVRHFGVDRFKGQNQIVCDALGSIIVRMQSWVQAVKDSGAMLNWSIDEPEMLCREWCDGKLELVERILAVEMPGVERYPLAFRLAMGFAAWVPALRHHSKLLRYRF